MYVHYRLFLFARHRTVNSATLSMNVSFFSAYSLLIDTLMCKKNVLLHSFRYDTMYLRLNKVIFSVTLQHGGIIACTLLMYRYLPN